MPTIESKITPQYVELMPDELAEGILYISRKYETAIHLCACGCKNEIVTPIDETGWHLTGNEVVSLAPSIGNFKIPCKSHYFIIDNQIIWA